MYSRLRFIWIVEWRTSSIIWNASPLWISGLGKASVSSGMALAAEISGNGMMERNSFCRSIHPFRSMVPSSTHCSQPCPYRLLCASWINLRDHDMITTPQRQEQEDDFSNNVRIFTEKLRERQNSGKIEFAS